jgi:hypothetical protein
VHIVCIRGTRESRRGPASHLVGQSDDAGNDIWFSSAIIDNDFNALRDRHAILIEDGPLPAWLVFRRGSRNRRAYSENARKFHRMELN